MKVVFKLGIIALVFFVLANLFLEYNLILNLSDKQRSPKQDRIDLAIQQEYLMTHDPKTKQIPTERLQAINKYFVDQAPTKSNQIWIERGPDNIGGRTRAMIFDAQDPTGNTVYAGSVSGGLWRSKNIKSDLASVKWENLNLSFENLAITAIAQDPSNPKNIYVGTGEGFFGNQGVKGLGVWKSTNGGGTWTHLSNTVNDDFSFIQDIKIAPNGKVYVGTLQGGLMYSTNKGGSWAKILGKSKYAISNQISDIEIIDNNTMFVAAGINEQDGIYKSINGGISWQKLNSGGIVKSNYERIEMAHSVQDKDVLFACFQDATRNDVLDLYKSTDQGKNWQRLNLPSAIGMSNFTRSQAWYNLTLEIDPSNKNHVWLGGIDLHKSTNGGASWKQVSQWQGKNNIQKIHADQHTLAFNQNDPKQIIFGNDGGIWMTKLGHNAIPNIESKNQGYNVTQLYSVAHHPDPAKNYLLAGAQDNGTLRLLESDLGDATDISGGDGTRCFIDPNQPDVQILSLTHNNFMVSTNGGVTFKKRFFGSSGQFVNAMDYDSKNQILYSAYHHGKLFKWQNPADGGYAFDVPMLLNIQEKIYAITVDELGDEVILYFATESGDIYKVNNPNEGSLLFPEKLKNGNGGYVSCITVNPLNRQHILVTYSNYGINSIEESRNGGVTWKTIEGNLPDMPVRWAMFDHLDNQQVYLATEVGVWETKQLDASDTEWAPSANFPKVRVDMLEQRIADGVIFAATHGRGLFSFESAPTEEALAFDFEIDEAQLQTEELSTRTSNHSCIQESRKLNIPITVLQKSSGNKDMVVKVLAGSTAGIDEDFQLTSTSFVINEDADHASFEIEILDDYLVEQDEIIHLELSSGPVKDVVEITIGDNDILPVFETIDDTSVMIGSHDRQSDYAPFRGFYEDAKSQIILTKSELLDAGLNAGPISKMSLQITQKDSDTDHSFNNFSISAMHTSMVHFDSKTQLFEAGAQVLYHASLNTAVGMIDFDFDDSFDWNGKDNMIIQFCFDNERWNNDDYVAMTNTDFTSMLVNYTDNTNGCDMDRGRKVFNYRPQILFTQSLEGQDDLAIASKKQLLKSQLSANGACVFVTDSNELLAICTNQNSYDIDCLNVGISSEGSGFNDEPWLPNNLERSKKAFSIESDRMGYESELFYKISEIQGVEDGEYFLGWSEHLSNAQASYQRIDNAEWQAEWVSSDVLKIKVNIEQSGNYFLVRDINKAKSQPLTLETFTIDQAGRNLTQVDWSISDADNDLKHVILQASTDGENFSDLMFNTDVDSHQGLISFSYDHNFAAAGDQHFYRIKLVSHDGTDQYSQVLSANDDDDLFTLKLFPNPTTSYINFVITSRVAIDDIQVYNITGQKVTLDIPKRGEKQGAIDIQHLTPGIYIFKVIRADGEVAIGKFTKE